MLVAVTCVVVVVVGVMVLLLVPLPPLLLDVAFRRFATCYGEIVVRTVIEVGHGLAGNGHCRSHGNYNRLVVSNTPLSVWCQCSSFCYCRCFCSFAVLFPRPWSVW